MLLVGILSRHCRLRTGPNSADRSEPGSCAGNRPVEGEWPKQGPKLLWQLSDIGDGYGPPAVVGGRIFVISNRGMDNEFVQALSVEDGKTLWTAHLGNVGNPNQQPPYPMARSTPTVDGDRLYAQSPRMEIVTALEVASGKVLWQQEPAPRFRRTTWHLGLCGVSAHRWRCAGGDAPGRGSGATLVALNKKNRRRRSGSLPCRAASLPATLRRPLSRPPAARRNTCSFSIKV